MQISLWGADEKLTKINRQTLSTVFFELIWYVGSVSREKV